VKKHLVPLLLLVLSFAGNAVLKAQSNLYTFDKSIALPGDGGYDYLSIDLVNRHLYVSHGTSVNVIDLKTETVVGSIDNMQGVHGIAIANEVNKGFITDGKNNAVVVFDLLTFKTIATIPLTLKGPDGIIYDPYSKKVLAFCGDADGCSVIDIHDLKESATIQLGGGPEFAVSDGKGLVYNNLEDKNSMVVIDTKTMKVKATYPLAPCGKPTGITLDPATNRIFTGCRDNKGMSIVDAGTGKVITTLPIGAGVDAVVFDAATKLIFCSNADATTTIIKQNSADDYQVVQTLTTQYRAKTMALDPVTHKIYLSAPKFDLTAGANSRKVVPGSFTVYVYKMN